MPQSPPLNEGSLISNRYRVLRLIGGGAMAHVYKVRHTQLGTFHALKELGLNQAEEGRPVITLETAQREARFLSTLSHPGLPKVTDFFHEGENVYLVMDYVEGQNLKTLLDARGEYLLDIPTVIRWGIQIGEMLTYLHTQDKPIIFRDIKPSNLILGPDGGISIVDFGIARQMREGAASDTIIFGSPGYAPPEQYGQRQTDPRSDIYALGATLHHLLTGRDPSYTPFKWPSVRTLNPLVPVALDKLIMKCLDLEREGRPESAQLVSRSLCSQLQLLEETNRPFSLPEIAANAPPESSLPPPPFRPVERAWTRPIEATAAHTIPLRESDNIPPIPTVPRPIVPARPQPVPIGERAAPARGASSPILYRVLRVCAVLAVLGSIGSVLAEAALAPAPPLLPAPTAPAANAPMAEQESYRQQKEAYDREATRAARALEAYRRLAALRLALVVPVCLAFLFGVWSARPSRLGMALTIGGVLLFICLTGAVFLPGRVGLFVGFALLESLLLIPSAMLLAAESE